MSGGKSRVPTVYQMTATECGAASLGMVLSYFGRDVPLQTLREQCGIGRDGATAKGIINGAQAEGLVAELHQTSATSAADLQTPFIAYWQHRHFLVVESHDRRGWHLNDPARGRYTVSDEQWAAGYSNYAIKLSPGPDFQRTREGNRSFFRELLWPMKGSWGPLVVVIATGVLLLVPAVALPTIAGVFIDDIVIAQNGRLLMPIIFALVLIGIYSAIMRLLDAWTMLHLSIPLHARLNASVLWRMLRLPTDFFTMRPVGGLMGRIGKAGALADVSMHSFPKLLLSSLTMLVMFAAVLWRSPLLALIAVISAVVTVASLLLVSRMRRETAQRIQATKFELSGKAMSGLRDMDSLKAQGASAQYLDSFMDTQAELLDTSQRLRRISAYYAVVPGTVSTLTNMALLIFGALEVMAGNLTVGAVVACLMLTKRFLAPVGSFLGVGQQLQTTHATVSQLNDVMQTPVDADFVDPVQPAGLSPASTAKAATEPAPVRSTTGSDTRTRSEAPTLTLATTGLTGQVSLSEVTFGYSQQHAVLNDITVDIPAGAKVGIVGRSGSGKSTLGNLICGVIHPDSGAVTFDGVDRLDLPRALLTTSIAKVNQPPMLFEGTVDDNVRLWDPSIPPEAVEGALVDAQCERFVGPRGGPSARVLAEGRNFSGGQVQRLEIARALARNPAVLILDEATSALDRTTESAIDAAVEARGCTRIIIAHRLSTIETCDVIYVLDKGRITESGTYAQLVAGGGLFSSLVAAQR